MNILSCLSMLSLPFTIFGGSVMPLRNIEAEINTPVLSIYGEAEISVAPDYAKIYGVIKKTSSDVEETIKIVDIFASIKNDLIEFGLEEKNIKSLYFNDTATNFDGEIVYRACLDFYVATEDVSSLKEVIELINSQENTTVKSITYELKSDNAYKEALNLATENALSKAESLIDTEKMQIREIQEECYYCSNSSYKDFITTDDIMENITVSAKVKVIMDYAEESEEVIEEELKDVEIDKETGEEIIESDDLVEK